MTLKKVGYSRGYSTTVMKNHEDNQSIESYSNSIQERSTSNMLATTNQ